MIDLGWKIGVEIELLAPRGRSRRDLADAIAQRAGGSVRPCFHPQSEPSAVAGSPIFENLTLGFDVHDADGGLIARCLDDLTLQADLDRTLLPKPGWWRVAGDDGRLLRLIMRHADPAAPLDRLLQPVAELFGTELEENEDGMVRLADSAGAAIAIAARLPGERERPCELVTAPIEADHGARLDALLGQARALGFTAPVEGATHLHFDGAALCSAPAIANLVALLSEHGPALRDLVGTNPRCVRLGAWPRRLIRTVRRPEFLALPWEAARARLAEIGLDKYCDFNLRNLVHPVPGKHTFEVRILPVWMAAEPIVAVAALFEGILRWAVEAGTGASPVLRPVRRDLTALIEDIPLTPEVRRHWAAKMGTDGSIEA